MAQHPSRTLRSPDGVSKKPLAGARSALAASGLGAHGILLLLWTAACLAFFAPILWGNQRFPGGDFSGQFHAFATFQAREMAAGRLPLWSPGSYAGTPFAADPQAAVFYLPRWITILFTLPSGLTYQALELEAIAHIWLAGVFCYLLGYALMQQRVAALIAAIAFGLGGYLTSYPILQLAILETIAWLPLILFLLNKGVTSARPLPWLVGAGLALGLSACAGHPQTLLHTAYLAIAYYLFLTVRARWRWTSILWLGAVWLAIGAGSSSIAWLPALRYMLRTSRQSVSYDFVASGLPMLDYVQALVPGVLSLWSPQYVGIAALGLAGAAWQRVGRRRAEVRFWAIAAGAMAWLALGDAGVLYELAYHVLPGLALFRQQERLLGLFSLSVALLAAQGMAAWLEADDTARRALLRRMAAFLGIGLALTALVLGMASGVADSHWPTVWLRAVACAALALLLLWGRRGREQRGLLLALLLAGDLYLATRAGLSWQPFAGEDIWPRADWMDALHGEEPMRLDSQGFFVANIGEAYGLEDIHGISPLKPRALEALETLPLERQWQLLNVVYVIGTVPPTSTGLTPIAGIRNSYNPTLPEHWTLYRFERALPRAWMCYEPLWVDDAEQALRALGEPSFDPYEQVVLQVDGQGQPSSVRADEQASSHVSVTRESASALRIDLQTDTPGYLVISEWDYPGWYATLDGAPAAIYTANYALQTVQVPAGEHQVRLRFRPPDVLLGGIVTLASLLAALVLACLRLRVRSRDDNAGAVDSVGAGLKPSPTSEAPGFSYRDQGSLASAPMDEMTALRSGALKRALRTGAFRRLFVVDALALPRGLAKSLDSDAPCHDDMQAGTRAGRRRSALHYRWLSILFILAGTGLRLFRLGFQELRGDEAFSYLVARQPLAEIIPSLLRMGEANPPLHFLLMHGVMQLAGRSEFALRLISVVPGVLLLPMMFQIGRRLGGERLGAFLTGLAAISSSLVWISQDARNQYTLAMLFGALATLLLARGVENPTKERSVGMNPSSYDMAPLRDLLGRSQRPARSIDPSIPALIARCRGAARCAPTPIWAAYALCGALTMYSHYYGAFVLLAHAVAMIAIPTWRKRLVPWVLSTFVGALLYLPWLIASLPNVWATGQFQTPGRPDLARNLVDFGIELTVGASLGLAMQRWLFLGALLLAGIGARELLRRERGWAVTLIVWLAGAALVIYLMRFSREMFNTYYILVAAPAWWVLVGVAMEKLGRPSWGTWPSAALALAVLVLANGYSLANHYGDARYSRSNGYRELAAYLAPKAGPGDVFVANFPDPCLDYYLEDIPIPRTMQPATYRASPQDTRQALEGLAAQYERLWFAPLSHSSWDPDNVAWRWLDDEMLLEHRATHQALTILAFRPLRAVDSVLIRSQASSEGRIQLDGAFVLVDGAPAALDGATLVLPAGGAADVTLVWRALQPIPDGYTAFVHLIDERGTLLAQHDGWPAHGKHPTWTWVPGERVLDRHELSLPLTATRGTLIVGMYHSQTVQRLPFASCGDAVRLAEFELVIP